MTSRIYQKYIAAYIIKSLQMSEGSNNAVYKLVTDNLQLVYY